ncbi:MAG: esterase-like activity of phytase family protein [Hyphomicrobium sp.]
MAKRAGIALAAVIGISAAALSQGKPLTSEVQSIKVTAKEIGSFLKDGTARATYGELAWRGGLELTSETPNFGGWSGLTFDATGNRFLAISDAGAWMTGELTYNGKKPAGIASAKIGPIKARDGKLLSKNRDRDAEAVSLIDGSFDKGSLLIAFERNDRVGRFDIAKGVPAAPSTYLAKPPEAKRLKNEGFEGMTLMRGGPFKGAIVAIAENPIKGETEHTGWMWIDGVPKRFTLAGLGDYGVTDAASLPDGTLLVLERRFRWTEGVKMRLRRIAADRLKPGAVVRGEVLLDADMSFEIDNMEGLAVRDGENGETLVTMISDDNFNHLLQRTVLLEFALAGKKKPKVEPTTDEPPLANAGPSDAPAAQ